MDQLDKPVALSYDNGKVSPSNVILIGYIILGISALILLGDWIVGAIGITIGAFICFTREGIDIQPEQRVIVFYTKLFGFIKIGKKKSYAKFQFLSVIPVKETVTAHSRISSVSNTDYKFGISLLNANYRNKTDLTHFNQRSQSVEVAKQLADRMGLEYFEYDPAVVRAKMMGKN
jgi:hypothetical protein